MYRPKRSIEREKRLLAGNVIVYRDVVSHPTPDVDYSSFCS
jgi:hypothetical protein